MANNVFVVHAEKDVQLRHVFQHYVIQFVEIIIGMRVSVEAFEAVRVELVVNNINNFLRWQSEVCLKLMCNNCEWKA